VIIEMKKMRIDLLLVERGLAESRSQAQRLVMAGQVRVKGQLVQKPSVSFQNDVEIAVDPGQDYVSRGGEKLRAALTKFGIDVGGLVCADVGASTGGFSDCLIQHGANKVFSIDVGKGILHWKLRQNNKVVIMEGVNARYLEQLPEIVDLVTIDASFISSKVLLPVVQGWFRKSPGQVILLIKPQFEAGRTETSRGKGVIRDPGIHQQVLCEVLEFAQESNYQISGLIKSPLLGPKGNVEFLTWLQFPCQTTIRVQELLEPLFIGE
jgi:23S rRNA (cytidine1920-2'-O)/16S rRNA (cytidine1409-2'-O)-methyltransferase